MAVQTLSASAERHLLQIAIALFGFVPVGGGLAGAILGGALTGEAPLGASLDNHVRFLSGLLVGIGLAYWEAIPTIEARTHRIRFLTLVIGLGGLFRLIGVLFVAVPGRFMLFALLMELVVAPAICAWQTRIARRFGTIA